MRVPFVRVFGHEAGQSIVELALAAPILVFALIGGIDLLRVGAMQQAILNGARVGAEYIATNPTAAGTAVRTQIWNEISSTPGLSVGTLQSFQGASNCSGNPAAGAPPCATLPVVCTAAGVPDSVCVSGRYLGTDGSGSKCVTSGAASAVCYVQVEVKYTFTTLVPWPLVPNQATIDRPMSMPVIR